MEVRHSQALASARLGATSGPTPGQPAAQPVSGAQAGRAPGRSPEESPHKDDGRPKARIKRRIFGFSLGKFGISFTSQDVVGLVGPADSDGLEAPYAKDADNATGSGTSRAARISGDAPGGSAARTSEPPESPLLRLMRRLGLAAYARTAAAGGTDLSGRTLLAVV